MNIQAQASGYDRLILISAWNDSGGGLTHRLFDGHPQLRVWPFELQLGTDARIDGYQDSFHAKYRWPHFPDLAALPDMLFDAILDDELKSLLREGARSKHADYETGVSLGAWRQAFANALVRPASRAVIVQTYIASFFSLWKARIASGQEVAALGHCPCLALDADEIIADFPDAQILHVVRDPRAGFADFRRRHPQMPVARYAARWNAVNGAAIHAARKWPGQVSLLRLESILQDREAAMRWAAARLEIGFCASQLAPTWNGMPIAENAMGPFGGVPSIGLDHERAAIASLSPEESAQIQSLCAGALALLLASADSGVLG